jgi:hypothetical protein
MVPNSLAAVATGTATRNKTIMTSRTAASIRPVPLRSGLPSKPSLRAQRTRLVACPHAFCGRVTPLPVSEPGGWDGNARCQPARP